MTLENLMKSELPCVINIASECRLYYDEDIECFIVKHKRKIIYCDDSIDGAIRSIEKLFNVAVDGS